MLKGNLQYLLSDSMMVRRCVYVDNLPTGYSDVELRMHFTQCGTVETIHHSSSSSTASYTAAATTSTSTASTSTSSNETSRLGMPRQASAFITMSSHEEAAACVASLNRSVFVGKSIRVVWAREGRSLMVSNLPLSVALSDVLSLFGRFGAIEESKSEEGIRGE